MGQDVCLIRSREQSQRYLNYYMRSGAMQHQLASLLIGATFKRINVADIKALTVLCRHEANRTRSQSSSTANSKALMLQSRRSA